MGRTQLKEFKKYWLKNYIEQYKNGNNIAKREIKNNLYKNINLSDDEKDEIWELIVRFGENND